MWSPRAQSDRQQFSIKWREMLENISNLDFYQDSVIGLLKKGDHTGLKQLPGHEIKAKSVSTYKWHLLKWSYSYRRKTVRRWQNGRKILLLVLLNNWLNWGFESNRLKNRNTPRIDGRSLDYSKMEEQKGDERNKVFHLPNTKKPEEAIELLDNLYKSGGSRNFTIRISESPMFQGRIQGTGPRYCPSIEDKINRFAERDRHQLFVEPEG